MLLSWSALADRAGPPSARLFTAKERLFGQECPKLRLWHDAAGWCPFCAQVWTVLEEMHVPYVLETIPLSNYMKPGEESVRETYKNISPDGSVPGIQIATGETDGNTGEILFGRVLDSCAKNVPSHMIIQDISRAFPDKALFPRTPHRRAYAEELAMHAFQLEKAVGEIARQQNDDTVSRYVAVMDDFESALSSCGSSEKWQLSHWGDDGDGDDKHFGGACAGPFLFGRRPCAVDILMLPWLERADAALGREPGLGLSRWPSVMAMLASARTPGICAWSDIGSDRESLSGIRQRFEQTAIQHPTAEDTQLLSAEAKAVLPVAHRDALARLSANHLAIARFAFCGAGAGRPSGSIADEDAVKLVDEALRAVGTTMLLTLDQADATPQIIAEATARCMIDLHGAEASKSAAVALFFLAMNVGVPRDMGTAPAAALRAFSRLVGLSLVKLGNESSIATPSL
eukprot:TRINITY_DN73314_c0_g1_i1.p1 TRINITY_DN73314_c0_g1~~TRINITY_DN73314_c0_g1_i1.p1  ORF type:complete len:458 (-),score=81.87 TRINITY_DN73314_c0_g1_i1:39-1412(-)